MQNYVELKLRIKELLLRGTDFLDRLLIDYESRSYKKVLTVEYETLTHSQRNHYAKCKGENDMPFKYLPNCASYQGVENQHSWIDMLFGQRRRTASQGGTIISWRNKLRNNFLRYRFRQMGYYRDLKLSGRYWYQALNLMRSDVFLVTSFNHVAQGWEKTMKPSKVKGLLREVKKMHLELPITMDYKRVYIPKLSGQPSGPLRPLGVPTVAWRIYLHMWNVMLNWWVGVHLAENQHAYQPGKGTWTAWRELYKKMEEEPQIYEFDLRNFFGGVDLDYNQKEMERLGIPAEIAEYLRKLNSSIVKLAKEDKLDESANRVVLWNSNGEWNPNLDPKIRERLESLSKQEEPSGSEGLKQEVEKLVEMGYRKFSNVGVPQGAATSCTLSLINLREIFERLRGLVMYADDGLYFPKGETEDVSCPEAGVKQAYEKSGWVKRCGMWEKSLKFLGLEYIPSGVTPKEGGQPKCHPRLRAFTREGSRLEFDEMNQFRIYMKKEYRHEFERWSEHWSLVEAGVDYAYPPMIAGEKSALLAILAMLLLENLEEWHDIERWSECWSLVEAEVDEAYPVTGGTGEIENLEEWVERQWERFTKLSGNERLGLLFSTEEGTGAMASLYQGDWGNEAAEAEEFAYKEWSWCNRRWGTYLRERINAGDLATLVKALLNWKDLDDKGRERYDKLVEEAHEQPDWAVLEARDELFIRAEKYMESKERSYPPEVERALGNWRRLLDDINLSEGNSSSFATDDLLNNMNNLEEWSFDEVWKYKYHKLPRGVVKAIEEGHRKGRK